MKRTHECIYFWNRFFFLHESTYRPFHSTKPQTFWKHSTEWLKIRSRRLGWKNVPKKRQLRVDMTNSLWIECSRYQQQRNKWIRALIGLKVNILMLNRLKTFFNAVFFFLSDVKISFSLFQKPWSHFPLSVVTSRWRRFSKLAPAWIILKFSTGGNQA